MGNSNSSDPPNNVGHECLIEKLEKENRFLREDLQNKNITIKILTENITDLNKKNNYSKVSLII